ncbi:MAG: hypothetical protein M3285_13005 [Actinomycetota bacterium]|nr:hypothetical protein [Actinomycetota bacterium]
MWAVIVLSIGLLFTPSGPVERARAAPDCSERMFTGYTQDVAQIEFKADFGCHRGHHVRKFRVVGKIRRCVGEDCAAKVERIRCTVGDPCRLRFARKHPNPEAASYTWRVRYRSTGATLVKGGDRVSADCTSAADSELCT